MSSGESGQPIAPEVPPLGPTTFSVNVDGNAGRVLLAGRAVGHTAELSMSKRELIWLLGRLSRALVTLEKGEEAPEPQDRVIAAVDPRWRIHPDLEHDRSVLAVEHPIFGWLAFLFPHDHAARIGQHLASHGLITPPPAGKQ